MSEIRVSTRSVRALEDTDRMPPALRRCVHEFGYAIVQSCLQAGVRDPNKLRQLVYQIWDGARQPMQKTVGNDIPRTVAKLDWILSQAGAEISAATLVGFLQQHNWVVLPNFATAAMIEASLAEVSGGNVLCTKREKHQRRLNAALRAGMKDLYPHLFSTEKVRAA